MSKVCQYFQIYSKKYFQFFSNFFVATYRKFTKNYHKWVEPMFLFQYYSHIGNHQREGLSKIGYNIDRNLYIIGDIKNINVLSDFFVRPNFKGGLFIKICP
jgi:hypothetical protein